MSPLLILAIQCCTSHQSLVCLQGAIFLSVFQTHNRRILIRYLCSKVCHLLAYIHTCKIKGMILWKIFCKHLWPRQERVSPKYMMVVRLCVTVSNNLFIYFGGISVLECWRTSLCFSIHILSSVLSKLFSIVFYTIFPDEVFLCLNLLFSHFFVT